MTLHDRSSASPSAHHVGSRSGTDRRQDRNRTVSGNRETGAGNRETGFDEAMWRLRQAETPADLFGADPDEATRVYHRMARLLHPDTSGGRTTHAFTALTALWRRYTSGIETTITTRRHSYGVGRRITRGDLADLYLATCDGKEGLLLKVARDPANNDLIEREAVALRQLAKDGDGRFLPYVPRLVESLRQRPELPTDAATGTERRANVIERAEGFHSLAAIHTAYPDGLDPLDLAWMWRRLLVVLGFAHRAGVLHGAVLPEHVLVHPGLHGLMLVDWCYSVPGCYSAVDSSGRVPAMISRYADWYPMEVPARLAASPATDLAMATRCMTSLMAEQTPKPLRLFAQGCLPAAQNRRPSDAWRLLGELDELLERLYGPRRFRPFHLPETGPARGA